VSFPKLLRRRPSAPMIISLAALVFAMSGLAVAASVGGSGTINACYRKKGGSLRIATRCSKREKVLSWKRRGPQGLRGFQGIQGQQGIPGPPGPTAGAVASSLANPPASPTTIVRSVSISTPTAGRLYVTAPLLGLEFHCDPGPTCGTDLGLYVDGKPIPGTDQHAEPGGSGITKAGDVTLVGVSSSVPAGPHTVSASYQVSAGTGQWVETSSEVGAVLLGG
jgi:hypothetical protein